MDENTSSYSSLYSPPVPEYGIPSTSLTSEDPIMYHETPNLAVPEILSSSEPAQGYTAFPATLNRQAYLFTPELEFSNPNELYHDGLLQAGYTPQQYNLPEDFTQPLNGEVDMASFHQTQASYGECRAWNYAPPSIGTVYPATEYPSPPPSTFASPESVILSGQTTASLGVQSTSQDAELIPDGTMSRTNHSAEYTRDLRRSKDIRFTQVVDNIVRIMAKVQVPMGGPIPNTQPLIDKEIQPYLLQQFRGPDSDIELQDWIRLIWDRKLKFDSTIATPAAKDKALSRRDKNKDKDRTLCICFWCNETLTTKNGLGNHVRSHLEFHLSFCDHCDFTSVNVNLPKRHLENKHGFQRDPEKQVSRRAKTHNNNLSPDL